MSGRRSILILVVRGVLCSDILLETTPRRKDLRESVCGAKFKGVAQEAELFRYGLTPELDTQQTFLASPSCASNIPGKRHSCDTVLSMTSLVSKACAASTVYHLHRAAHMPLGAQHHQGRHFSTLSRSSHRSPSARLARGVLYALLRTSYTTVEVMYHIATTLDGVLVAFHHGLALVLRMPLDRHLDHRLLELPLAPVPLAHLFRV